MSAWRRPTRATLCVVSTLGSARAQHSFLGKSIDSALRFSEAGRWANPHCAFAEQVLHVACRDRAYAVGCVVGSITDVRADWVYCLPELPTLDSLPALPRFGEARCSTDASGDAGVADGGSPRVGATVRLNCEVCVGHVCFSLRHACAGLFLVTTLLFFSGAGLLSSCLCAGCLCGLQRSVAKSAGEAGQQASHVAPGRESWIELVPLADASFAASTTSKRGSLSRRGSRRSLGSSFARAASGSLARDVSGCIASAKNSFGSSVENARQQYTILVERTGKNFTHELRERQTNTPLGMILEAMEDYLVVNVIEVGLISQWNEECKGEPELQVRAGDHIIEIEGVRGDGVKLLQMLKSKRRVLKIILSREALPERTASEVFPSTAPSQSWLQQGADSWVVQATTRTSRRVSLLVAKTIGMMVSDKGASHRRRTEVTAEMPDASAGQPLMCLPAKLAGNWKWSISGIYTFQAAKVGLRTLDLRFEGIGLLELSQDKYFSKQALIRELLAGNVQLKDVTGPDMSAAQLDLKNLSLVQLVRLKVLCIDDAGTKSDSHHGFLTLLDDLVFHTLAEAATSNLELPAGVNRRRLGLNAILFVAASTARGADDAALWPPLPWIWWIDESRKVLFDPASFTASEAELPLPDGGVLEFTDSSKKEKDSGNVWMEWQVRHCRKAEDLQAADEFAKVPLADMITVDILAQSLRSLKKNVAFVSRQEDDEHELAEQQLQTSANADVLPS